MKRYEVLVESLAQQDLLHIRRYISLTLKMPLAAKRIYDALKSEISTLDQNPLRHACVSDEPYASRGVRRLFVENYCLFYLVDEAESDVHVIRVLYNRREWVYLL